MIKQDRKIKVRAWDPENKKWLDPESGGIYCEEFIHAGYSDERGDWVECPVVEYTGLNDKNGQEIYEGDVVRWKEWAYPITVDDSHGYRFLYGKDLLCKGDATYGEVIGNIYENPELLEKRKQAVG